MQEDCLGQGGAGGALGKSGLAAGDGCAACAMFFIASQSGSHPAPSTSLKAGSSRNSEHAAKSGGRGVGGLFN
jgi:hypothetical protein